MMGSNSVASLQPPQGENQGIRCPRCDSPNTKFCYYNNYSLAQPRHFCKTCRRYWTKGGSLRNVPVGGGCRKNKKPSRSSSAPKLSTSAAPCDSFQRLSIYHGCQPDGAFVSFADLSAAKPNSLAGGFNFYPIADAGAVTAASSSAVNGAGNVDESLASSIESLSSMNQVLHWRLQQQRLAMFFEQPKDDVLPPTSANRFQIQQQPNLPLNHGDHSMMILHPEDVSLNGNDGDNRSYQGNWSSTGTWNIDTSLSSTFHY